MRPAKRNFSSCSSRSARCRARIASIEPGGSTNGTNVEGYYTIANWNVADQALNMLDVDERGFDHQDRRLLLTMIEKFDGGPVGIDSLAAAISEERHTIEDVLEPYLIQQGYIMRTPRGRVVTRHAYLHFGLNTPARMPEVRAPDLFEPDVDAQQK